MEFRIETLEEFKIIGYAIDTTNAFMKGMRDCPKFWKEIVKEGKTKNLLPYMTKKPLGIIGASVYNIDRFDQKKFKYFIAVATDNETPNTMDEHVIPAMMWAVFPCTRKTLGKTQMNIVKKWAPKSDYILLNTGYFSGNMVSAAPDLEVYAQGDDAEIWVPVKMKD